MDFAPTRVGLRRDSWCHAQDIVEPSPPARVVVYGMCTTVDPNVRLSRVFFCLSDSPKLNKTGSYVMIYYRHLLMLRSLVSRVMLMVRRILQ